MRNAFANEITAAALANERIVLLSGDIGNKLFDRFKEVAPTRFFNCGVAEANLIGVASGMAMNGLRPVAYTIAPFITYRCYEQIRVDLCYHKLPVVIVGVGAGLSYASLGATHHSCEDLAVMRALPEMIVLCPADPIETRLALRAALKQNSPVYIRLGKKGEPCIHASEPIFEISRAIEIVRGDEVCILACGTILPVAQAAVEILTPRLSITLASFPCVKPLDTQYLDDVFAAHRLVVTLEEHSIVGGFGSAVAEWLADNSASPKARLLRLGTPDEFFHLAGDQEYARKHFQLTGEVIATKIGQMLGK